MPITRRSVLSALSGLGVLLAAGSAIALERKPFDAKAFAAAQAAGRPILVEVTAPWCPTCKAQKPIIEALAAKPAFKALAVFAVDYDTQKDALRSFNARKQSTLVAFRGRQEVGRSVGDTNPASIEALVQKAL